MPVAIGLLALVAAIGAVLVVLHSPSSSDRLALLTPPGGGAPLLEVEPPSAFGTPVRIVVPGDLIGSAGGPNDPGEDIRIVASVVLIACLAGIVLLCILEWLGGRRTGREGRLV